MRTASTLAVEAPQAQTLSTPTLFVLILGMGSYLGWQTVGISPTLFPTPLDFVSEISETVSYFQTLIFFIMLGLCGYMAKHHAPLINNTTLTIAGTLLLTLSSALTYSGGWILNAPLGYVVGMLLNGTKAILFLMWAESLCKLRFQDTLLCVSLIYGVAFTICLIVAGLQEVPALLFHCLIPLLSGGCLFILQRDTSFQVFPVGGHSIPPLSQRLQRNHKKIPWRLLVGVGLFGAIILITNTISEMKSSSFSEIETLVTGLFVSLVVALVSWRRTDGSNFTMIYRMLTPIMIIAIILVLSLQDGYQHYEAIAIGISWAFFRIFSWTLWCLIAHRSHEDGAFVFAAGQIILTLCSTLAQLLCTFVLPLINAPLLIIPGIIALTVINSAFVMSEGDIRRFLEKQRKARELLGRSDIAYEECVQQLARKSGLSNREQEIALLVMEGKDNTAICEKLVITESTLRTHLRNMYGKAEVHSRQELIDLLFAQADDDDDE